MPAGVHQRVVARMSGLDHHPSSLRSPTGAPRHLCQQLKRALGGAKVGEIQPGVGIHHPD
jgi:hypothetical protein